MKQAMSVILVVLAVFGGGYLYLKHKSLVPIDPKVAEFQADADRLIQGLQQYKAFFKHYPTGTAAEISAALSGQALTLTLVNPHHSDRIPGRVRLKGGSARSARRRRRYSGRRWRPISPCSLPTPPCPCGTRAIVSFPSCSPAARWPARVRPPRC